MSMDWFGGSLSTIRGQIANLTREVLTEDGQGVQSNEIPRTSLQSEELEELLQQKDSELKNLQQYVTALEKRTHTTAVPPVTSQNASHIDTDHLSHTSAADGENIAIESLNLQLQELQNQKTSYEQECGRLKNHIHLLERQLRCLEEGVLAAQSNDALLNKDDDLQKQLRESQSRVRELEHQLQAAQEKLLCHLKESETNTSDLREEVEQTRLQLDQKASQDKETSVKKRQKLENMLTSAACEGDQLSQEILTVIRHLGDTEPEELVKGTLTALHFENQVLKRRNDELEILLVQKVSGDSVAPHLLRSISQGSTGGERETVHSPDSNSEDWENLSEMSELSLRNRTLDQEVKRLQSRLDDYERDLEHWEMMRSDWAEEKQAMEHVVFDLREKLKSGEEHLSLLRAKKGLLEAQKQNPSASVSSEASSQTEEAASSSAEARVHHLEERLQNLEAERNGLAEEKDVLQTKLFEVEEVKESLQTDLEELDSQHREAIDQLLQSKDLLLQQISGLERELHELKVKEERKDNNISKCDGSAQTDDGKDILFTDVKRVADRHSDSLRSFLSIEIPEEMFERKPHLFVDRIEYVSREFKDAKWKTTTLERKMAETSAELRKAMSELDDVRSEKTMLEDECAALRQALETKEHSLETIAEDAEYVEVENEKLKEVQTELASVKSEKLKLEAKILSLEEEMILLKSENENLADVQSLNASLLESNSQLQDKLKELLQQKEENAHIEDENCRLREQCAELEAALNLLQGENRNLKESEGEYVKLKEECDVLQLAKSRLEAIEESQLNLESQVNQLTEENGILKDYQNTHGELKQENMLLKSEIVKLLECQTTCSSLREDVRKIEDERENLRETLRVAREQIQCLTSQNERLQEIENEKRKLTGKLEELTSEIEKSKLEIEEVTNKQSNKNVNETLEESSQKERFSSEKKDIDEANPDAWKKVEDLELQLQAKENENASLLQKVSNLERPLSRINKDDTASRSTVTVLEEKIHGLEVERLKMMSILDEKTRENSNLKAENHQLVNIISAEKTALAKLQQDNQELVNHRATQAVETNEMTRETVRNLSKIVRDKDLEIELLKQKNDSLLAIMQQSNLPSHYIQDLIAEKDILTNKIQSYENERESLAISLKQKHEESVRYHAEVQRLASLLDSESQKLDRLRHQHRTVSKQYEDKQKLFLNLENEMIYLKQRLADCEHQQAELREANNSGKTFGSREAVYDVEKLKGEVEALTRQLADKDLMLREKEDAIHEKEGALKQKDDELSVFQSHAGRFSASANVMAESQGKLEEHIQLLQCQIQSLQEERDNLKTALSQQQRECKNMQNQVASLQEHASSLQKELDRLRQHLLEVEETYTAEAIQAEEREKELRSRLALIEDRARATSTAYTTARRSVEDELISTVAQRDEALRRLNVAEKELQQHRLSLSNLQSVLDQFQREKEREVSVTEERIWKNVVHEKEKTESLLKELQSTKAQLLQAKEGLEAAARLGEQLDKKTEIIAGLKSELAKQSEVVRKAEQEKREASTSVEGKIDKQLIRNLIVGCLAAPVARRKDVLRIIATVLDFSAEERGRTGLDESNNTNTAGSNQSLSAAFVQFLESESRPKAPLIRLPTGNLEPRPPSAPAMSFRQDEAASGLRSSPPMLLLPTFTSVPVGRSSSSILKDVLKDNNK